MPINPVTGLYEPPGALQPSHRQETLFTDTGPYEDLTFGGVVEDLFAAPFRGAANLGANVVGLVSDPLFGTDISGSRPLGESETIAGGIIEGLTQFAIPFSQAGKVLSTLGRVAPSARGYLASKFAGRQLAATVASGAAKGAIADLVAFGGREERLSNWVAKIDPTGVAAFLAADEDDPELLGRLKNVLEGAGLGIGFDLVFGVLRSQKRVRKHLADGGDPEKVPSLKEKWFKDFEVEKNADATVAAIHGTNNRQFSEAKELLSEPPKEALDDIPPRAPESPSAGTSVDEGLEGQRAGETPGEGGTEAPGGSQERRPGALEDRPPKGRPEPPAQPPEEVQKELESLGLRDPKAEARKREEAARDRGKVTGRLTKTAKSTERIRDRVWRGEQTLLETLRKGQSVRPHLLERFPQLKDSEFLQAGIRLFEESILAGDEFLHSAFRLSRKETEQLVKNMSPELKSFLGYTYDQSISMSRFVDQDADVLAVLNGVRRWLGEEGLTLKAGPVSDAELLLESKVLAADILSVDEDTAGNLLLNMAKESDEWPKAAMSVALTLSAFTSRASKLHRILKKGLENASSEELASAGVDQIARGASGQAGQGVQGVEAALHSEMRKIAVAFQAVNQIAGNAGRTLRSHQIPVFNDILQIGETVSDASRVKEILGNAEFGRRMEAISMALENPDMIGRLASLQRMAKLATKDKVAMITRDWWIQNILAHPRTWVVNGIMPALHALSRPFELMAGGLISKIQGDDAGLGVVQQEWYTLLGSWQAAKEAVKAYRLARKEGPRFDPFVSFRDDRNPNVISSETFEAFFGDTWSPDKTLGRTVEFLGKVNRIPSSIMGSTDDAVKTFAARASAYGKLMYKAKSQGMSSEAASEYVAKQMDRLFEDGQILSERRIRQKVVKELNASGVEDPAQRLRLTTELEKKFREEANFEELNPVSNEILHRARDVAAQTPLKKGSFAHKTQRYIDQTAYGRLIVPFFRTPANLFSQAFQRSGFPDALAGTARLGRKGLAGFVNHAPVPELMKKKFGNMPALEESRLRNFRDLASENPEVRAAARGRMATGAMVAVGAFTLAQTGALTGAGPRDKEQRRLLTDAGWLPYAFRMPNGDYVQYLRADPIAMSLGFWADAIESAHFAIRDEGEDLFSAISLSFIISTANNLTDRTYLAGIQGLVEALSDPERHAGRWVAQLTAGSIPRLIPDLWARTVQDPVMKEAYGLLDQFRRVQPYLGELPPMRNMWGEPIRKSNALRALSDNPMVYWMDIVNPIAYREGSDDFLTKELASLQHGFSPPPRKKYNVFLPDYKNEKGQDAYDRWGQLHGKVKIGGKTLAQSMKRLIKSRSYQSLPIGATVQEESPRVQLLKRVRTRYRQKAWEQVLQEYPDLAREVGLRQVDIQRLKAGRAPIRSLVGVPAPFGQFLPQGPDDPNFLAPPLPF